MDYANVVVSRSKNIIIHDFVYYTQNKDDISSAAYKLYNTMRQS